MNKQYISALAFVGLMIAALFATLSDTDRARLIQSVKAQPTEAAELITKPEPNEPEINEPTEVAVAEVELCNQISGLAETIMDNRQSGVPMSAMIDATPIDSVAYDLIVEAYQYPRLTTERLQQGYIRDFADEAMVACLKGLGGKS